MSRQRVLPPVEVLVRWRDEGLTQQQIADRVNTTDERIVSGELAQVTRSAVSVALVRADKADQRNRYSAEIPWSPIRPEHQKDHSLTMLRTWARVNSSDATLPQKARDRYERFAARLERDNVVVDYNEQSGFSLVPRRPGVDTGLIRAPN
ncbi:MAG: hypothetical protein WBB44_10595 [Candidatus Nanopelagicales bacterium]|nr:hypothetical protein [Candidatus Nanopelagicales bacterium]